MSYKFYRKPTDSKFKILEPSGGSYQQKKTSLSQEVVRRLLNTEANSSLKDRETILNNFSTKLEGSGYKKAQIREIVESGVVGYCRRVDVIDTSSVDWLCLEIRNILQRQSVVIRIYMFCM